MKRTTLTINYKDSTNSLFVEQFDVNLERFKDILYIDEKDIGDVVRQIEKIESDQQDSKRWISTKTLADVKKENAKLVRRSEEDRPSKE